MACVDVGAACGLRENTRPSWTWYCLVDYLCATGLRPTQHHWHFGVAFKQGTYLLVATSPCRAYQQPSGLGEANPPPCCRTLSLKENPAKHAERARRATVPRDNPRAKKKTCATRATRARHHGGERGTPGTRKTREPSSNSGSDPKNPKTAQKQPRKWIRQPQKPLEPTLPHGGHGGRTTALRAVDKGINKHVTWNLQQKIERSGTGSIDPRAPTKSHPTTGGGGWTPTHPKILQDPPSPWGRTETKQIPRPVGARCADCGPRPLWSAQHGLPSALHSQWRPVGLVVAP